MSESQKQQSTKHTIPHCIPHSYFHLLQSNEQSQMVNEWSSTQMAFWATGTFQSSLSSLCHGWLMAASNGGFGLFLLFLVNSAAKCSVVIELSSGPSPSILLCFLFVCLFLAYIFKNNSFIFHKLRTHVMLLSFSRHIYG